MSADNGSADNGAAASAAASAASAGGDNRATLEAQTSEWLRQRCNEASLSARGGKKALVDRLLEAGATGQGEGEEARAQEFPDGGMMDADSDDASKKPHQGPTREEERAFSASNVYDPSEEWADNCSHQDAAKYARQYFDNQLVLPFAIPWPEEWSQSMREKTEGDVKDYILELLFGKFPKVKDGYEMAVESRKKKEADSDPASQTPVSSSSSGMDSENTPKLDDAPQQVDSGTMDTMEAATGKANKQAVKGLFA